VLWTAYASSQVGDLVPFPEHVTASRGPPLPNVPSQEAHLGLAWVLLRQSGSVQEQLAATLMWHEQLLSTSMGHYDHQQQQCGQCRSVRSVTHLQKQQLGSHVQVASCTLNTRALYRLHTAATSNSTAEQHHPHS
jgi:hypothetical protein